MTEVRTAPVIGTAVSDIDDVRAKAGAFEFYADAAGKIVGMIYGCPCGCGKTGALPFRPAASPSWEWDGDEVAPTLSPSVHHVGHWHGWLKAGVWTSV